MALVSSPSVRSVHVRRLFSAVAVAAGAAALLQAQVPGRNVNMVSGRDFVNGDPYLQRQNEPSVAASTRNPLHLLAGANDYRTVDIPGLEKDDETGDAWLGVFKSYDGGNTWRSTLIPGYPQDPSLSSPLKGYTAGADPVVRAGSNGLFYYSGIVFDRATPGVPAKSALLVSRFIDNNNQETGDPIVFIDSKLPVVNGGTAFIDKPWFAVDVPRAGAQMCEVATQQRRRNGQVERTTQRFPGGAAYASYTLITGEGTSLRSQIYLVRSTDCGATWSEPQQISSSLDPINQGATLAIDPRTGTLYVAWRRFTADGTDDSIMVTRSMDQGRKWDPPGRARRFPRGRKVGLGSEMHGKTFKRPVELAELASLDQPTREDLFRTNAYPTMTVDNDGRVYVAWSERGFNGLSNDLENGDARVVIASSTNVSNWTLPVAVDNEGFNGTTFYGHQVMPSISFSGGKLMIAYYDFRDDVSGVFRRFVDEWSAVTYGDKRHTVDVRAAMATPGPITQFGPSVRVSEYLMGNRPNTPPGPVVQLQYNAPNLKLFKLGTVPFFGDYIDLAPSPAFVSTVDGGWAFNTAPSSSPLFHAVWTDNRDVVPPINGDWQTYTPPPLPGVTPRVPCAPGREGMRNQNIYTARITGGLVAGSPGNSKPLDPKLPRGFVVFAQNATETQRTFRLTIENQPAGAPGKASFLQASLLPPVPPAQAAPGLVTTIDVTVPRRSTIARNVYAISTDPDAQIHVSVKEIGTSGEESPSGLAATVILNPDISNPDISNPDISNPDISNPDISNAEVANPDISNPDISNPDISNPDISNPDISNPDISNVQVANPDISNPDISNPDISNPDISNPDISNPDISNATPGNDSMVDTTWTVTNNGNTTASFSVKLLLSGVQPSPDQIALQLILRKIYVNQVSVGCVLKNQPHNQLLANITNPVFTDPENITDPGAEDTSASNATLWLAPGESAKVTLRVRDLNVNDTATFDATAQVTPAVVAQAVDVSLTDGNLVVGDKVAVDVSAPLNAVFLNLPQEAVPGVPLGNVSVRFADAAGAPLPPATVSLSVHSVPTNVQVGTTVTSTSSSDDGIATFALGAVPGGVYRLKAQAGSPQLQTSVAWSGSFTVGPVQWGVGEGGNGNFYEYVRVPGLSWTEASAAAATRTHNGVAGRLATIGSAAENQFVNGLRNGGAMRAWIGLYDPDGSTALRTFEWITSEADTYRQWAAGEPNNPGTEFWVEMFTDGTWNNNTVRDTTYPTLGYLVEYAGAPQPAVSGRLTFNSTTVQVGTWTQNVAQTFRLTVNMDTKRASLSIDGFAPDNAQNIPFTAAALNSVSVELGTTGTQRLGWDDITVRNATGSPPVFSADFSNSTVGGAPSAPAGGTWSIASTNGSVLVRASSGNLSSQPVEIRQNGGPNSVSLRGNITAAPQTGTWIVEWKSVMTNPGTGYPGSIFAPIVVRGSGAIIAAVEYR